MNVHLPSWEGKRKSSKITWDGTKIDCQCSVTLEMWLTFRGRERGERIWGAGRKGGNSRGGAPKPE